MLYLYVLQNASCPGNCVGRSTHVLHTHGIRGPCCRWSRAIWAHSPPSTVQGSATQQHLLRCCFDRKAIAPLLRFTSSKSGEGITSLTEYIERAKPGQKSIYYIAADSLGAAASAPFVEQLIKKDLEVGKITELPGIVAICSLVLCASFCCRTVLACGLLVAKSGAHSCVVPCQ